MLSASRATAGRLVRMVRFDDLTTAPTEQPMEATTAPYQQASFTLPTQRAPSANNSVSINSDSASSTRNNTPARPASTQSSNQSPNTPQIAEKNKTDEETKMQVSQLM